MQASTIAMMQPGCLTEEIVQKELKQRIGNRDFEHWFCGKTTTTVLDDQLTIGVASPFVQNWMQKHFKTGVLQAAQRLLGDSARVRFEVDTGIQLPSALQADDVSTKRYSHAQNGQLNSRANTPGASSRQIGAASKRCFADLADFVEGACNVLSLTAVQQVCEAPGRRLNPLVIHGGVGIGKTHLLEGCYQRLRRKFPSLRIMFLTAEAFANYFTQALAEHTLPSFRQRFRNVDVLLVDDVDFFDGKRVIQEEFLHTFQQLESHHRQIVVTSDRHPRLLTKLSDELVSRFLSGLVCRVESPDLETRKRIVQRKAIGMEAEVTPDALNYIAERFKHNIRELEGALNCLRTYYLVVPKPIGIGTARKVLSELERDCVRIVRLVDIEQAVCDVFGVRADDLRSAKRQKTVSQPRMLAMFLARKHTQAAYREIGQYFGGRNHSTVMSAEKKIRGLLSGNETIQIAAQSWPVSEVVQTLEERLIAG